MKRRLFTIFAFALVVAMIASMLVGCSFFQENDYRTANETYVTVKHPNGITLTVSYNEILDYCNGSSRLYSYVNYYGLSVGEALDLCIQGKIQSAYLLADAMGYLTSADKTSEARVNALFGKGAKVKAEDVLTYAERYAAIFAVNDSIDTSLETNAENAKAEEWTRAYNKISSQDVEEIVLTDATLAYLDKFFGEDKECLVGAELDLSKIVAKVIYEDGSESAEFVVPSEGYSVAFSSAETENYTERTEDKNFTVKFTEVEINGDEEVETEHTYVYDYTLVYPRDVKAEEEEETDYTKVTIDEVKVDRYALDADIPDAVKAVAQIRDVQKEYDKLVAEGGDKYQIEAYRVLIENMKNNNRDMAYYYKSQFDAMAVTALQEELYKGAEASFSARTDLDAEIVEEFKYLYNNQKNTYHGNTADENKDAFISTITSTGTGMDTLYYHPAVVDIDEYFFVKQVLFKFDANIVAFLEDLRNDEDAVEEACKYFMETEKVIASNPDYDVDFDCPLHELKEEGATCTKSEEDAICPSIAYAESEEVIADVIARMQSELSALYAEDKYDEAKELFEKYLYSYCDDAGSFNANWGYLITADKDDNSWVGNFTDLAKDIYAYNTKEGNTFTADGQIGVSYTYNLTGTTKSDYAGVSVMMVAKTPFVGKDGSEFDISAMTNDQIIAHLKSQVKGDGTTLYDALKEGLETESRNLAYSNYVTGIPQDIFERDEENNKITVNKDYKDVIEINTKKLKKNIYDEYLG